MSQKRGLEAKIYRSATPLAADGNSDAVAATWLEMKTVMKATTTIEKGEAETSNRGRKMATSRGTLKKVSVKLTMINDSTDTDLTALLDAYDADAVVALAVMDGDITVSGTRGPVANWEIFSCERGEDIDGMQTLDFTVKPSSFPQMFKKT